MQVPVDIDGGIQLRVDPGTAAAFGVPAARPTRVRRGPTRHDDFAYSDSDQDDQDDQGDPVASDDDFRPLDDDDDVHGTGVAGVSAPSSRPAAGRPRHRPQSAPRGGRRANLDLEDDDNDSDDVGVQRRRVGLGGGREGFTRTAHLLLEDSSEEEEPFPDQASGRRRASALTVGPGPSSSDANVALERPEKKMKKIRGEKKERKKKEKKGERAKKAKKAKKSGGDDDDAHQEGDDEDDDDEAEVEEEEEEDTDVSEYADEELGLTSDDDAWADDDDGFDSDDDVPSKRGKGRGRGSGRKAGGGWRRPPGCPEDEDEDEGRSSPLVGPPG